MKQLIILFTLSLASCFSSEPNAYSGYYTIKLIDIGSSPVVVDSLGNKFDYASELRNSNSADQSILEYFKTLEELQLTGKPFIWIRLSPNRELIRLFMEEKDMQFLKEAGLESLDSENRKLSIQFSAESSNDNIYKLIKFIKVEKQVGETEVRK